MITIQGLEKKYAEKVVLDKLSLTVPPHSIFGLLGPNGAGKTTLISILNGLTSYDKGEISVLGLPLKSNGKTIRERCSLVPQSLAFYEQLSVKENLMFFAGIQRIKGKTLKNNLEYAVERNQLEEFMSQTSGTLSGGQKRRLNIAIGLLNNPDILFFDEPTVGIDPESRNEILDTIKALQSDKKTVVYTSHYMPEIEKICDQLAIINKGQIIKQGSIDSMLSTESSEAAVVELYPHTSSLSDIEQVMPGIQVVDSLTLALQHSDSQTIGQLLSELEKARINIKQIRYGASTLESVFISLTSTGDKNV